MVRALEFIDRVNVRFAFFLCLSILGHIVVLIYALPTTFPNLKDELPSEAKLKALTVKMTQTYSDYHEPIIVTENTNLTKADLTELVPDVTDTTDATITEPSVTEVEKVKPEIPEIPEADTESEYKDDSISGSKLESILNEKYYLLSELDELPETQTDIDVESLNLLKFAQGGKVELRLWVSEQGQVVNVEVLNSEMPPAFVEGAIKLFLQARFSQGMVNNNPVKFVSKVVIRYDPH